MATLPSSTTTRAGLSQLGCFRRCADTDLEVSRLFVRLLGEGYSVRSRAKGESMRPLIARGDLLTVRPARFVDILVGDVVVYGSTEDEVEHTLTTHRVIGKVRRGPQPHLLARDDATGWVGAGERVFPEQIYGKVLAIERANRRVRLDRPFAALVDRGRIMLVRGIASGKRLIRRLLPDLLGTWLLQARRPSPFFRHLPASRSDSDARPPADGSPEQPSCVISEPQTDEALPCESLALDLRMEPNPDVLVERMGDQLLLIPATGRLVDMESVYTLNSTGAEVWDMIAERRRLGDLIHDAARRFETVSSHVAHDLNRFLSELMAIGAVRPVGRTSDHLASARSIPGQS